MKSQSAVNIFSLTAFKFLIFSSPIQPTEPHVSSARISFTIVDFIWSSSFLFVCLWSSSEVVNQVVVEMVDYKEGVVAYKEGVVDYKDGVVDYKKEVVNKETIVHF